MYRRFAPLSRRRHGCLRLFLSAVGEHQGRFPQHRSASFSLLHRRSHSLSYQDDQLPDPRVSFVCRELEGLESLQPVADTQREHPERGGGGRGERRGACDQEVEVSHRWPEWVDLMEKLVREGYLDRYGLRRGSATVSKDANRVRIACLNFARDRLELIRYLSRKDIQIIVGSGCPSSDRKVANSGKRLRAHVGIEEGKVCSSCNLRGNCERAYLMVRKDERGRTVDVMRMLLTHGLELAIRSLENQSCLTKTVEESARRLLHEMVEFNIKEVESNSEEMASGSGRLTTKMGRDIRKLQPSQMDALMKQGDWICPECNFLNFAKNIKCLRCNGVSQEKLKKLKKEYEHLPLKKGDWICDKCNFLNFAKNTKCLQCNEKPTKRQLNPGEWECTSCNYINFRRNNFCLKCDWKRPKASNSEGSSTACWNDTRGHSKPSRISFVRNENSSSVQYPLHLERDEEEEHFWSSSDDDSDDTLGMPTGFKDFQRAGGRSVIVQHPSEKERQQVETLQAGRVLGKGVSAMGTIRSRVPDFDDSCSEDEIAEWFGYGKNNRNVS